jgi:glycosyltransferase involved in cell wall biosynthesis
MYISVIVPVYNVEKYIEQCILSIIKQTYKEYELILVDDGSPDNCPAICDKYAATYNNIKVIHKKNGGLSDARNVGVLSCSGEYVTFIDSDDYVDKHYLETLVDLADGCNSISVVDYKEFSNDIEPKRIIKKNFNVLKFNGKEAANCALYQKKLDTRAWGILIPISIVRLHPFPYGKYHEDDFTTYKYYLDATNVSKSTAKLYFYRQRENSIMHFSGKALIDELDAADAIVADTVSNYHFLYKAAKSKQFSNYCQVLFKLGPDKCSLENRSRILNILNDYEHSMINDKNARLKNRLSAILLHQGLNIFFAAYKIMSRL